MEKKIWRKPEMNEFAFAANEYVAACGDQNKVYKFVCDALGGNLYYWAKRVYQGIPVLGGHWEDTEWTKQDGVVDGKVDSSLWEDATLIGSYTPCGKEHEASVTDEFFDGFVDYNGNSQFDDDEAVIVWRGESGFNGHATKNLDMSTWETAKS